MEHVAKYYGRVGHILQWGIFDTMNFKLEIVSQKIQKKIIIFLKIGFSRIMTKTFIYICWLKEKAN